MARPLPREPPVSSTARPSPAATSPMPTVHHLVDAAAAALERRRAAVVGPGVADGDAADGRVLLRHPEGLVEGRVLRRLDAEEAGPQPLVDRGQQHQQGGHAGVDVPVRHGPACLVLVDGALVRLGVAVQVGLLVRQRDDQQRRPAHALQPAAHRLLVLGGGAGRPEPRPLLGRLEDQERPALAEAGRRRADRVLEQPLAHLGGHGAVGVVVADHVPHPDDVSEFHDSAPRASPCPTAPPTVVPRLFACRSCSCSPPSTSPTARPCAWSRARPGARAPTATRRRRRWPGSATARSGCTWSTSTPPSAAAPTASCWPGWSASSTSTSSSPAASGTTSRWPPRWPPAAGGSTWAPRRWSRRSGARGPSPSTATGSPSASTSAAPGWPPAAGPARAASCTRRRPGSTRRAAPATSSPTSPRTARCAGPTSTCCARSAPPPTGR